MIAVVVTWVIYIHAVSAGLGTTCIPATVERGSPANVTCHFLEDVSQTRKDVTVQRYTDTGSPAEDVLKCFWLTTDEPLCDVSKGYSFDGKVSNTAVLQIPAATDRHKGSYVCQAIPEDRLDPCNLTIGAAPTTTETHVTQTTNQPDPGSEEQGFQKVVVPLATSIVIAVVIAIVIIIIIRCRKKRERNVHTARGAAQRTDKDLNNEERALPASVSEESECRDHALKLLQDTGSVVIAGPQNSGKSVICQAVVKHLQQEEYIVLRLRSYSDWQGGDVDKLVVVLDQDFTATGDMFARAEWSNAANSIREESRAGRCKVVVVVRSDAGSIVQQGSDDLSFLTVFLESLDSSGSSSDATQHDPLDGGKDKTGASDSDPVHEDDWFTVCRTGSVRKAKETLVWGRISVNVTDSQGDTALHVACRSGEVRTVKQLLLWGSEVEVKNSEGRTPLHIASYCGEPVVVDLLIKHKAKVDSRDKSDSTPLHLACMEGEENHASRDTREAVVRRLLDAGAKVTSLDKHGRSPLHLACLDGREAIVNTLLAADSRSLMEKGESGGRTPLLLACRSGHSVIVEALLSHGADVEAVDKEGLTALHHASISGSDETVQMLLGVSKQTGDATARDYLLPKSNIAELLKAGDSSGRTPLHHACLAGQKDVVRTLLSHGADRTARDKNGATPEKLAREKNHKDIVKLVKN